ncbi:MAG: hypothetical protein ACOX2U_04625 [Limisphaerales bacterium]|nr:hypothetical protein [Verrucomicrobiota bacterium]
MSEGRLRRCGERKGDPSDFESHRAQFAFLPASQTSQSQSHVP